MSRLCGGGGRLAAPLLWMSGLWFVRSFELRWCGGGGVACCSAIVPVFRGLRHVLITRSLLYRTTADRVRSS